MTEPREPSFTAREVEEAFAGFLEPATVTSLLQRYREQKRMDELEQARMERMVDIIEEFDEVSLLEREGGGIVKASSILYMAKSYLVPLRDQEIVDDLDEKARLVSLYILAALEVPYSGSYKLEEELEHHPISESQIKSLMKQYVVDKFGPEAWKTEFDDMEFSDLFMYKNMPYFDGESFTEILRKQPLLEEIREELDREGFGVKKGENS